MSIPSIKRQIGDKSTRAASSRMAPVLRHISAEKEVQFLQYLRQFGQAGYAASMTGMSRRTYYARRAKDPEFRELWDEAIDAFEGELTARVIQTAMELGTGNWVLALDEAGQPELDDDFEPVYRFETTNVDARVLNKLLGLRMSSADGPSQTNVQVNNTTTVTTTRNKPRLVRPSIAQTAQPFIEDAEVVQGAPQETGGVSDA